MNNHLPYTKRFSSISLPVAVIGAVLLYVLFLLGIFPLMAYGDEITTEENSIRINESRKTANIFIEVATNHNLAYNACHTTFMNETDNVTAAKKVAIISLKFAECLTHVRAMEMEAMFSVWADYLGKLQK